MRVFLRDLTDVKVSNGTRIRFSVTVADDNEAPIMTIAGWTIDQKRRVQSPASRTHTGRYFRFIDVSDEFTGKLKDALEQMEIVQRILGPNVEGITYEGRQTLEGEAEIFI